MLMDFKKYKKVAVVQSKTTSYDYNRVKIALEKLLRLLGLDRERVGQKAWNPLGEFIEKGDNVLIKPNLIRQSHMSSDDWEYVITHHTVIEAVVHYVYKALQGTGQVVIADGPQTDSDFAKIYEISEFDVLKRHYQKQYGYDLRIFDLREEEWKTANGIILKRTSLSGDPLGYMEIDLGIRSEFASLWSNKRYYGANPNFRETQAYHSGGHHRYRMASSALDADVVINLPKLKTHKKTGVTLSLKNLVGVHGNRNYLPHHTMGTPAEGGDEFEKSTGMNRVQSRLIRVLETILTWRGRGGVVEKALKEIGYKVFGKTEEVVRSGNWYGNNTTWRMVLDLNKILFYATADGTMTEQPQRKYLSIVDGIIAGEGDGPMAPDPKPCGILVGGFNPVAVDCVCAHVMGFDIEKIPLLRNAFRMKAFPLVAFSPEEIEIISNRAEFNKKLLKIQPRDTSHFKPHFGWRGHIEREEKLE